MARLAQYGTYLVVVTYTALRVSFTPDLVTDLASIHKYMVHYGVLGTFDRKSCSRLTDMGVKKRCGGGSRRELWPCMQFSGEGELCKNLELAKGKIKNGEC